MPIVIISVGKKACDEDFALRRDLCVWYVISISLERILFDVKYQNTAFFTSFLNILST